MAWTTSQVTQNGNTTTTWVISGSALSSHDCIVVGLTSNTTSRIRINRIDRGINPRKYYVQVAVIGSSAAAYRFYAEQMDWKLN